MKLLSALLVLLPLPAFAHPGNHSGAGLLHMLTSPDHLATVGVIVLALVLVSALGRVRR